MSASIDPALLEAAYALDEQATGRVPVRARRVAGALALETLMQRRQLDCAWQDVARGLKAVAAGATLEFELSARQRAGRLAHAVRAIFKPSSKE